MAASPDFGLFGRFGRASARVRTAGLQEAMTTHEGNAGSPDGWHLHRFCADGLHDAALWVITRPFHGTRSQLTSTCQGERDYRRSYVGDQNDTSTNQTKRGLAYLSLGLRLSALHQCLQAVQIAYPALCPNIHWWIVAAL